MIFRQPTVGRVRVGLVDNDGVYTLGPAACNTVTHEGIDLLARMLAWDPVRINIAYMEFVNDPSPPSVSLDPAEGRAYYAELDAGGGVQSDYLRVDIVTQPTREASRAEFEGNRVVFSAFSAGTVGVRGTTFGTDSRVFGLAVGWAPDADDRTQDVIFARVYGFTPVQKSEGHQIMLRWSHTVGDILP